MSVTEEIKQKLDIVNYIGQFVPLKKAGRYYKANCPFHAEKTPSFIVNPETQSWRCFGACAEGGDIFNFAQKQHGWTFAEALRELGQQAGVEIRKETPHERQRGEHLERLRGLLHSAAEWYHQNLITGQSEPAQATLAYVKDQRGFTETTIRQFMIGYAPPGWQNLLDELTRLGYSEADVIEAGLARKHEETGRVYDYFRHRLMIPIRDERGRVIGFGARALAPEDEPKYLNSPQTPLFDKSQTLFGLDTAKRTIRDSGTAVIVEGYMDAIQAQQAGFTNVVAQMGTAMTEEQLGLLVPRYAQRIILALDADVAGQTATRRSLETARQALESDYTGRLSVDIRLLQLPDDVKDPDDLIRTAPERWRELVENTFSIADFVIATETQSLPSGGDMRKVAVQERMALALRLLPILAASESNIYVESNLQKLAQRLYLNERELLDKAVIYRSKRPAWSRRAPNRLTPSPQEGRGVVSSLRRMLQTPWPGDVPGAAETTEPPSPDYDTVAPPDFEDAESALFTASPESKSAIASTHGSAATLHENAAEAYCLRMLFMYPDMYYQINRKFRELAGGDARLQGVALDGLGSKDFSRSDYSRLMGVFVAAINQHETSVLDFLFENLDPILLRELNALLVDENAVARRRLSHRHNGATAVRLEGELNPIWKLHEPDVNPGQEILIDAMQLRLERIRRELDELYFMQIETQQADQQAQQALMPEIVACMRAKQRLDVAVVQPKGYYPVAVAR